jgi:adenine deaminase
MGIIAPGRYADILLVSNLSKLQIDMVIAKGIVVADKEVLLQELPSYPYPEWVTESVKLGHPLTAEDFLLETSTSSPATINIIGVVENQAPTKHLQMEIEVVDEKINVNMKEDLAKVALVERHQGTGGIQVGFVKGFGFTESCGLASTVAHDCHHMIVVGTNEEDMALAANELARVGGGQIVVKDGEVIGKVELPIAGLMSNESAEVVAEKSATVLEGFKKCGCTMNNPNMQLSLLALVVIPELRISDLGLVDATKFEIIPVIEE